MKGLNNFVVDGNKMKVSRGSDLGIKPLSVAGKSDKHKTNKTVLLKLGKGSSGSRKVAKPCRRFL